MFFSQLPKKAAGFAAAFKRRIKGAENFSHQRVVEWVTLLFSPAKKNCTSVAAQHATANSQALNHFLTDSAFDFWELQREIASQTFHNLKRASGKQPVSLVIDESSFLKKGIHSCGVARQYAGCSGKTDNCQVGVYAALTNGTHHGLVRTRLYLPQEWVQDPDRMRKARVPEYAQTLETKIEICKEMVFNLRSQGIAFEWVNFDSFYGRSREMLAEFDQEGICYVADIPCNSLVYEEKNGIPLQVNEWGTKWKYEPITLRRVAGGDLKTEAAMKRVWVKSDKASQLWHRAWLLIRKDSQGKMHYLLSNYKGNSLLKLAQMHGRRYWIEKAFREAKDSLGMDQYQIRTYPGWHRWMSLIMLAMLFVVSQALLPDPIRKRITFEAAVKFAQLFTYGKAELFEKQLLQWYADHPDKWIALLGIECQINLTK